jgi:hypothetical protein
VGKRVRLPVNHASPPRARESRFGGSAKIENFGGAVGLFLIARPAAKRENERASDFLIPTLRFQIIHDCRQWDWLSAGTAKDSAVLLRF